MRLRFALLAAAAIAAATCGFLVTMASAAPRPSGVVALFCGHDTIPADTTQLQLRIRWVVRNSGQITKFLAHQKLVWTIYNSDDSVRLAHTPSPEYGDETNWSAPVHFVGDLNNDGVTDDVWYSDYLAPTGITLHVGESVRVAFTLTADSKTDDGFRGEPGAGPWPAYQVISSGTSCLVTGA
jgi:hypothetical protein